MPIKKKYTEGQDYVVTKWGSEDRPGGPHDNYECAYCQYKTLDADAMNQHLDGGKAVHARHPYPDVDPEDKTVKWGGRHPLLAQRKSKEE